MADSEEQKKTADVPDGTVVGTAEPTPRGDFIKMDIASREFVKKYGQPDLHTFLIMVGSDGILAQRVVNDLLQEKFGEGEAKYSPALDVQAPQENNITGRLDHTGDVATKIHTNGESTNPPVNAVSADVQSQDQHTSNNEQ